MVTRTRYWIVLGLLLTIAGLLGWSCFGQAFTLEDPAFLRFITTTTGEAPPACSTGNTTNAWDNFLEGFQTPTTGFESNGWALSGTTNNITMVDSTSLTSNKPDGACNQCIQVVVNDDGTETWASCDLGVGGTIDLDTVQTDVFFSFYVVTGPNVANEVFSIFGMGGTSVGSSHKVQLHNVGGVLKVYFVSSGTGDPITISAGQWYVAKISFDTAAEVNGSAFYLYSGGSLVGSDTTITRLTTDVRYIAVGSSLGVDAGDNGTVLFDIIAVKTN